MRLVGMGTGEFACHIFATIQAAGFPFSAFYTKPPARQGRGLKKIMSPVHQWADKNNIKLLTPQTLSTPAAQNQLSVLKPDLVIVVAYGLLLPKPILEIPKLGCWNVHPSLLPRWRGAAPIERALLAGDKQTGISLIQMNEQLDEGDILLQHICEVGDKNKGELYDMLKSVGGQLAIQALRHPLSLRRKKQPLEGANYAPKIKKSETELDVKQSAKELSRKIRAFSPTPCAFIRTKMGRIKILKAKPIAPNHKASSHKTSSHKISDHKAPSHKASSHKTSDHKALDHKTSDHKALDHKTSDHKTSDHKALPGEILAPCLIACGEGALYLEMVQKEGKHQMSAEDFWRGSHLNVGDIII